MDAARISNRVVLIAVGLSLAGCPARRVQVATGPERLTVWGTYVHPASRVWIPERIADFRRDAVIRYDAKGLDVIADYSLVTSSHHIAATVHVYPGPSLTSPGSASETAAAAQARRTEAEFERCKQEVDRGHPGARVIEQRDVALTERGRSHAGKVAVFEFEDLFAESKIAVRSSLYVFCCVDRRWTIKYRFTHPAAEDADGEMQEFIENWSWHGERWPQELVQRPVATGQR
jgi:hypothetical protein